MKVNIKTFFSKQPQITKISSTQDKKRNWNFMRNYSKYPQMSYTTTCSTKNFIFIMLPDR